MVDDIGGQPETAPPNTETIGEGGHLHPSVSDAIMSELVKLRKRRKIGQEPIAKAIGISQARVSQMENLKGGLTLDAVLIYAGAIGAEIIVVSESRARKKGKTTDAGSASIAL